MTFGPTKSTTCVEVIVALGSNNEAENHLAEARLQMEKEFGSVRMTRPMQTKAIGLADSPDFLNALITFRTKRTLTDLNAVLKQIERRCGRTRKQNNVVAIDLDVLLYDKQRLHPSDWERPYIKILMQELTGDIKLQ